MLMTKPYPQRAQRKSLMISSVSIISSSRELDLLPIMWDVLVQETLMAHLWQTPPSILRRSLETYECTFVPNLKRPDHHLKSQTSELCNDEQIRQYQTLIRQLKWAVTLGRHCCICHDNVQILASSQVRTSPMNKKNFCISGQSSPWCNQYRTHEPDDSHLSHLEYDWARTVYAGAREELPHNLPKPLGKQVTSTCCVDANLHSDLVTGKEVTAILHMLNATQHCKRQLTVETATFCSEFVAARTAVNQIIDIHLTHIYLGVPINPKSHKFGATIPTSTLSKQSHLDRVQEAIVAGYLQFNWQDGKSNPADIHSKHWGLTTVWPLVQPLLFWRGDPSDLATKIKGE